MQERALKLDLTNFFHWRCFLVGDHDCGDSGFCSGELLLCSLCFLLIKVFVRALNLVA